VLTSGSSYLVASRPGHLTSIDAGNSGVFRTLPLPVAALRLAASIQRANILRGRGMPCFERRVGIERD
jgi:hypothetical protein